MAFLKYLASFLGFKNTKPVPQQSSASPPTHTINLSIVTQFYPPDYAATGQFVEELARNLSQQKMQVQVFTGQPGYAFGMEQAPQFEQMGMVEVRRSRVTYSRKRLGRTLSSVLFCARSALHLLNKKHRGDIILFVSEPPYLQTLGYIFHKLFKIPYACLVYDLYPDVAVELGILSEQHWLVKLWNNINRRVWNWAEAVIVPSETMQERIVARAPELAKKISVIHNWADPTWIKPIDKQQNTFAKTHELVEPFTVLYSGNMGRCHDMDTILGTARELSTEPVQFVFIGGGPKRQECQEKVQEWGLSNCRFLPYQEKSLLPHSLTACDLSLVSVDVGMEGLVAPSKFYSALSSGRPVAVICEPHSYLRQLVAEADCGAAFNNGDSQGLAAFIRYLAKDTQMKGQMGGAGHRFIASHFTPQTISQQYLKVLQRAVLKDTDLYRAVEQGEFRVHYQPLMSLSTNRVRAVEALLRWQCPTRGLREASEFLAAAEETGLIVPIGWWLINEACRQLHAWQQQIPHCKPLKLHVNLCLEQFRQSDLIPQLDRILHTNHLTGHDLVLEVSETVLMADPAATTAILLQLRSRNIEVCIDNFGTGSNSLNVLHRFSVGALAIDRSLIARFTNNDVTEKLINTVITLAHDLDIAVSARGIETEAQLHQLKAIGIQQGQGFLFTQPVEADETTELIIQHNQTKLTNPDLMNPPIAPSNTDSEAPLVLVVDDDRMMRVLLRRAAESEGYRVIEAETGEQAIALYRSDGPDLVLLDAIMPMMDGFACCTQLRQLESPASTMTETIQAHALVLMITSLDDGESVDRAFAVGATDYITKPVNWAVLRQRMRRLLST
jgi:EAL domain-containing protein (putative c-di-GMP-specific phosphodiesterase class I)/glycosyltransferase involved in cell wall biosynthesis/ActR/RegA family two-component response regulator